MDKKDIKHLINRLEQCVELLKNKENHHMVAAKILADISVLKAMYNENTL